jgi:hypothetical protein
MDTTPRLPSRNDPTNYAPYSIMAVMALVAAVIFLLVMLILGGSAWYGGTQLIEPLLLIMPAIVLVLSFAARRQISNSEGTRVGLNLCNIAWWIAIVGGFGYISYLAGRMIAVRQDAKTAVQEWFDVVEKANPLDMTSEPFHRAFQMTLPTGRQQSLDAKSPAEREEKQRGFRDDTQDLAGTVRFRQSDFIRMAYRNQSFNPKFSFDGLKTWVQDTSGMMCEAAATLRTPEGEAYLEFKMLRQLAENGRPLWRVVVPQQGLVRGARMTRYGQKLFDLELSGRTWVNQSLLANCQSYNLRNRVSTDFAQPQAEMHTGLKRYRDEVAQMAALGGAAVAKQPPADYERFVKRDFFMPLVAASLQDEAREKFYAVWTEGRILPPGVILAQTPDTSPLLQITEQSVTMRVPIELQLPRLESSQSAARAWFVLVCDDAKIIGELNELRKAAPSDALTDLTFPQTAPLFPWKLKGIESDMKHVTMPKPPQPGAPDGPGGMGGH